MNDSASTVRTDASRWRVFFACAPGLEPLLLRELHRLLPESASDVKDAPRRGGIELRLSASEATFAFLHVRCADGIRVRVGERRTTGFRELIAFLQRIPWHAWLQKGATARIYVTSRKSRLIHTDAIKERVADAILAARGVRLAPNRDEGHLALHVRLDQDVCTVSMDALLGLAHRRGHRLHTGNAPMRETLAAALLEGVTPWPPPAVWDPCCGSGTVLLESVVRSEGSAGRSPSDGAWPAWPAWPAPDDAELRRLGELAGLRSHADASVPALVGGDVSAREVDNTRTNLDKAGWLPYVRHLQAEDVRAARPELPAGTWIVSNLPYGKRSLTPGTLDAVYHGIEQQVRRRPEVAGALLVTRRDGALARRPGWERVLDFDNRGTGVSLYRVTRAAPTRGGRGKRPGGGRSGETA